MGLGGSAIQDTRLSYSILPHNIRSSKLNFDPAADNGLDCDIPTLFDHFLDECDIETGFFILTSRCTAMATAMFMNWGHCLM